MKNKFLIAAFLLGIVAVIVGAFLRVMHYPGGMAVIGIGMLAEAVAIILIVAKIIGSRQGRDFLNR
jgi:uncharacterized membrane protein YvlD (DUF360 family)